MTFEFNMTQQEYLRGCRYKMKKQNPRAIPGLTSFVGAGILFLAALVLGARMIYLLLPAILLCFGLFEQLRVNAAFVHEFSTKPYLYGVQCLTVETEGLRVQNGFEKLYTEYHKIYAVKSTKKQVILLLTYRKGVFVLDRQKQDAAQVEELLRTLRAKGVRVDGK